MGPEALTSISHSVSWCWGRTLLYPVSFLSGWSPHGNRSSWATVHLILSGTATFGVIAALIIFCYIKRKKMSCLSSSSQPVAPSAPAIQNHLPHQLQQFQQQQQLQLPTPAVNHLALPQHQIQQEIRLMIESELSRAMNHQRTPTTHPSFESAPGHMESPDYKMA